MDQIEEQVKRWRLKAEELRTTADHIENPFAQASFRRMADTYDRLAHQFSENFVRDHRDISKVG